MLNTIIFEEFFKEYTGKDYFEELQVQIGSDTEFEISVQIGSIVKFVKVSPKSFLVKDLKEAILDAGDGIFVGSELDAPLFRNSRDHLNFLTTLSNKLYYLSKCT